MGAVEPGIVALEADEPGRVAGAVQHGLRALDDRDAIVRHVDVPQYERRRCLTDRPEADEDESSAEFDVLLAFHFINCL